MSQKCVHKGCGKRFDDPGESPCVYHPGPPVFHEGQKGWQCCKPRVLTFDEFLEIPPCTTGKHSAVDDTPQPEKRDVPNYDDLPERPRAIDPKAQNSTPAEPAMARIPISQTPARATPSPKPPEETDEDDPSLEIPAGATCRRRGCDGKYTGDRSNEKCVFHPGIPIFHEGSKGYTCCKRRVLEFDQFLKLEGCTTKDRHLFIGSGKTKKEKEKAQQNAHSDKVTNVRYDFYQTPTQVIASFYLKKIDKAISRVEFHAPYEVLLDLKTADGKVYFEKVELWGPIDQDKSAFRITPQKLELTIAKSDFSGWPVLKASDNPTGEIIQSGRAGFA